MMRLSTQEELDEELKSIIAKASQQVTVDIEELSRKAEAEPDARKQYLYTGRTHHFFERAIRLVLRRAATWQTIVALQRGECEELFAEIEQRLAALERRNER